MKPILASFMAAVALTSAGCVRSFDDDSQVNVPVLEAPTSDSPTTTGTTSTTVPPTTRPTPPEWLGETPIATDSGLAVPIETPARLLNRAFATPQALEPPKSDEYEWSISAFEGEPLARSTYTDECPVPAVDLRYLTMSFWGFDGYHHTGEMVVAATVAQDIVQVFERLHAARFPIEEMRITTPADLTKPPTGDANNTSAFECRQVTGGKRWSDHALGTAIDLNPFHNPYIKGSVVLPELALAYTNRSEPVPGMVVQGDVAVTAFAEIGWSWGGAWRTLKDWQHFSLSGR